jgi:hypothetical protein
LSVYSRNEDPNRRLRLVTAADAAQQLANTVAPPEKKKQRAVQDGELVYTSVSQLQRATPEVGGCLSKWYFRYVLGLPDDPPGKGQLRGTAGHGRIEDYLITGVNALDNLERRGMKHMPEPNVRPDGTPHPVPVLVEAHFGPELDPEKKQKRPPFVQLTADGVPVVGFIDLIDPRDPRWLLLKDWKFKASIGQWGVKPADLVNPRNEAGIQIIGYLEALRLARAQGVFTQDWAIPSHVTFQTQGAPDVIETTTENADGTVKPIQLDSAKALWETVTRAAIPAMRRAAKAKSHTDVPKNQQVCHKYRKACPYLTTCLDRMARIRAGFASKTPAPAVQGDLMGMLTQMTGGAVPVSKPAEPVAAAPIHAVSASKPAAASATLIAQLAQPGQDYEVKGASHRYLTTVKHGESTYAQFTPTAGGPPVLVELNEPIKALAAPLVLPPDAPKSTAGAVQAPAGATQSTAVPEGQLVQTCEHGVKYEVNGQIGEYTGSSLQFGFFQTTAGSVKLLLTDRVKPLKAAPAQATAQGGAPQGAVPQSAEAPKTAESGSTPVAQAAASLPSAPSAAEVKEKKPRKKTAVTDVSTVPDETLKAQQPSTAAVELVAAAGISRYTPPTHSVDGNTAYGAMGGVRLYFGCSPIGVATQTLGPYVDALERELLTKGQVGVHDVRVAQDSTFGFNKWKGYLAEMAKEKPPPAGHYVVTGYADERIALVAETLAQRAEPGCVTRGGG